MSAPLVADKRGSYMSANVLLNLLNELGNRDNHMTLKLLKNHILCVKTLRFCHLLRNIIMDIITLSTNLNTTSGLSIVLHGVISLPDLISCDKDYLHRDNNIIALSYD